MSLWDDYKADMQFEHDFPFGVPTDTWITKDGTKIKLTDMTEQHIKNCMNIVGEDDAWYDHFQKELDRRQKNVTVIKRRIKNCNNKREG